MTDAILTWVRGLGRRDDGDLRESLEALIVEHGAGAPEIDPEWRLMLMNILRLGAIRVEDVMVPRADIIAIDVAAPIEELLSGFRKESHSRLPVYSGSLDEIVGMVHIKDLPSLWQGGQALFDMRQLLRDLLFVPPSMKALDLLKQMRASRTHMAIVVDEFGGTDGLVTIEDLVEEIVGEIADEHALADTPDLVELANGALEADARYPVEDLERRLGIPLVSDESEEEIDTLGGLVFALVGRVPQRGELIRHASGLCFEILEADPRRIKRLKILPRRSADSAAGRPPTGA